MDETSLGQRARNRSEIWSNVAIGLAALVFAAILVYRDLWPRASGRAGTSDALGGLFRAADQMPGWRTLADVGVWIGDSTAPNIVVGFMDFECPFCRRFHSVYNNAQTVLGDSVAFLFVHFPLPGHRFAQLAAQVSMCAHEQGQFAAMHDRLLETQDSFGLKPWRDYASAAGVPDLDYFDRCVASREHHPLIAAGASRAAELGLNATPTVIVNGWRHHVPPYDSLVTLIRRTTP